MQHFRFVASSPKTVFVKSVGLAAEQKIKLLKDTSWASSTHQLPPMVVPMRLSAEWQLCLYGLVLPSLKLDSVCPKPI